jgi:pimeloyl-ACP methyl ester carboxylesterase
LFSDQFLALPDTENEDPELNYPTNRDRFAANELYKRRDKEGFTRKGFILQAIAAGWHRKTAEQLKQMKWEIGDGRIAVLHGTEDRMITFRHAELLKEAFGDGVTYRFWDGRGHVLMWEEEDQFNAFIEDFVGKNDRTDA